MQRIKSLGMGITAGLAFGTAAIFIRLLPSIDSNTIAFARLFIGFLGLLALISFKKEFRTFVRFFFKYNWKRIVMGILLGFHFIFFVASVQHTTVLHATIFVNTTPIQALVISIIALKIKPTLREVTSVILGFAGVLVIALAEFSTSSGNLVGDIESLISATLIAIYLNIGADLRKKIDTRVLMTSNFLLASFAVFFFALPVQGGIFIPLEYNVILILLALGLIPTAIGHTLYVASVKALKPYEIATVTLLEAVSATILAAILFGEIPGPFSIVGAIFIAVAIFLLFSSTATTGE